MPALEVIRYELLSYGYILMATLMGNLLALGSHSILETYFCVLATNSNCFLNRVIFLIGYTTRWGGGIM